MSEPRPDDAASSTFPTTHWSWVVSAARRASPEAREALAALYSAYWYPLYAFIRRSGFGPEQARDLTQDYFAHLLEKDVLAGTDPCKGRFRAFLRVTCRNFLANQRDFERAQKRGSGRHIDSLNFEGAEGRYGREPADALTPERLFDRRWALTLLERVVARLEADAAERGKSALFERLKSCLTGERGATHYAAVARDLGMTEAAVKMAASRLRKRYQDVLRDEIASTVADPADVEEEIRDLFEALKSPG